MPSAPAKPQVPPLAQPVTALRGVGAERAAQLARLGIHTIEDLLLHRPWRYEDRRHFRPIGELRLHEAFFTRGTVVAMGVKTFRKGSRSLFELILTDGTTRLHCRWWNLPYLEKYYTVGNEVLVYGKLKELKPRTIDHPEVEILEGGEEESIHLGRIAPVYPLTEGLPQRWLRGLVWRALEHFEQHIAEPWPGLVAEPLPPRATAVRLLHFPATLDDTELARRRLALDEFIPLQRDIQERRRRFEAKAQGLPCAGDNRLIKPFLSRLGFVLTAAQTRVLREIRADLGGAHPMRRLLQGDVGSGKTAVAACAALMALESGFNVAIMAPTEILAGQHFRNFTRWFEPLGLQVELQTGSRKTREDAESKMDDASPRQMSIFHPPSPTLNSPTGSSQPAPSVFIGTHALIEEGFGVERLGLVIIDEQHKFGVAQRERLVRKGAFPHLLVMTATPIPRTLGLTLYGDLDLSVIDEMPAGRGRIRTFVRGVDKLPKVWAFIRDQLAAGRQAYIVYPRVEETDGEVKAVTQEYDHVVKVLAPFRVGLLHGRLRSAEKDGVMSAFRLNTVQALLATSLVEVGVDVANATVMLIENAEQFGLAQLHQLRGRIGRGAHESYCILVSNVDNPESRARLRVLEETTDGFHIAEADLKLRGPGELLGQQQSGLPRFRFGDLRDDFDLIRQARQLAARTLANVDPPTRGTEPA